MHREERDVGVRVVEQRKKQMLNGDFVVPCGDTLDNSGLESRGADPRELFDDGFVFDEHAHGARIVHRIDAVGIPRRYVRDGQ